MDRRDHWESLYRSRPADQVSWYQAEAEPSLRMIREAVPATAAIIDIGGGASILVDALLSSGYHRLSVLDLSPAALATARTRLGKAAAGVTWIEGDVLDVRLPKGGFDLWHDRAVFHFLTDGSERKHYVHQLDHALVADGHVVIATFAPEAPDRCSGLPVIRYSPEQLHAELGPGFRLVESARHDHRTPAGLTQAFTYCLFRR